MSKLTPEELAVRAETRRLAAEAEERFLAAAPEFKPWPKIGRLNRDIVITEKIDGTNAAVVITETQVYAQSRTRVLTPQKDNFGFRAWVDANAEALRYALGIGTHFGEWWGKGIQRGYGQSGKTFSLFNTDKWFVKEAGHPWRLTPELEDIRKNGVAISVVPVLYEGPWVNNLGYVDVANSFRRWFAPDFFIDWLHKDGSVAAPDQPAEGIVVFHYATGTMFKATVDNDAMHKFEVPSA
jgi:hypothetical protein